MARGGASQAEWAARLEVYQEAYPEQARELVQLISGDLPERWDEALPSFPTDAKGMATRVASGKVMNALATRLPGFIGGSADLDPSTYTGLLELGDFGCPQERPADAQGSLGGVWGFGGKNLHFGVREHGMGSILNGLAAHGGTIPFGATFLIFSDYMRPSMRLAALMGLGVVYVFTHDSIALGEDGPTHQPVEQLANLRAVPNLTVIRPCDANEAVVAWQVAIETKDSPVALILSRQSLPVLDRDQLAPAGGLRRGAYVLAETVPGPSDIVLIASGSEVSLALAVHSRLLDQGVKARVVSMPSWELFDRQTVAYRESVFPPQVKAKLAIEAGGPQGWHRYVGEKGETVSVEGFGASAPGEVVMSEYGFSVDDVLQRALSVLHACRLQ